ncbi:hypothetical protein AB0H71_25295 [Nocardia sp. NPDC050697]|uniref:hypothetical protein n=1 Tax=Nocardia sp. NPDC050697 TaxID=3155158 RepID=UPI003406B342
MVRYPDDPSDDEVDVWVDLPRARPELHVVGGDGPGVAVEEPDRSSSSREVWLAPLRDADVPATADIGWLSRWRGGGRYRLPRGAWAVAGVAIAVLIGVVVVTPTGSRDTGQQVQSTAAPPSPSTAVQGPCAGLSGEVVTDRAGDPATLAGVIASFEAAYFIDRDVSKAMPLLAPETGITADALAAGIASIPPGTRHCVAISEIAPGTATVHIAEVHPDRTRVDYLQLINTRPADTADTGTALLISNFQKQG